ncbi:MAG: hypothetical protein BRD42_06715 [Bacteroidetes bacterium QS_3_64_15]|nr:MAG: hypothetical protein BRD42_06715 [Bacteroidetes bacterium QS_3_64_15]
MQTPERPFDGNVPDDGAPSYEWLDEWLCEYVDGAMDPSVEAVFKQYVEANPELKAHVERLRQTRDLLCGCDAPDCPAVNPPPEVSREGEEDLLQSPTLLPEETGGQSAAALGILSSIAVALAVGFLAGAMLVEPDTLTPSPTISTVEGRVPSQESVRGEMSSHRPNRFALPRRSQASSFSTGGPLAPRPETVPALGGDTVDARSTLSAVGER